MAYSEVAVANMTEVKDAILDFADTELLWTVASNTITYPSGEDIVLAVFGTTGAEYGINLSMPSQTANLARMNSPRLNGAGSVSATLQPTAVHLFGGEEDGVPFLAAAVNFNNVGWRHIYIGGVVPVDAGTPGQLVMANWHIVSNASSGWPRDARDLNKWMFSAYNRPVPENESGFAYIPFGAGAAIRPNQTAAFPSSVTTPEGTAGVNRLVGGVLDGPNDTLVELGQVHFASATILIAPQLYVTEGSPARLRPIGHPAGLRLVNMTNYNTGQQVLLGSDEWRVFPEFRKTNSYSIAQGTSFAAGESSFFHGLAYPEAMET